ncbi:hypothetical protein [Kroppenstedtia pulmonis]|nr:hypothetical protein [Kroppenstedtia pulmonis]
MFSLESSQGFHPHSRLGDDPMVRTILMVIVSVFALSAILSLFQ